MLESKKKVKTCFVDLQQSSDEQEQIQQSKDNIELDYEESVIKYRDELLSKDITVIMKVSNATHKQIS